MKINQKSINRKMSAEEEVDYEEEVAEGNPGAKSEAPASTEVMDDEDDHRDNDRDTRGRGRRQNQRQHNEKGHGKRNSGDMKTKGRGHDKHHDDDDRYDGRGGVFERLEQTNGSGPMQCKNHSCVYFLVNSFKHV